MKRWTVVWHIRKNKLLAVLAAAMVGVAGFAPMMSVQAFTYERPCYICGQDSLLSVVLESRYIQQSEDPEACRHGHKLQADYLFLRQDKVNYYCSDCDVHWERWEDAGLWWYCTEDKDYHFDW